MGRCLSRLVCLALFFVFPLSAGAQSEDARFVDGLRQRRLFRLAEEFCRHRLTAARLNDTQRAELLIELIRCYASHAAQQTPQERDSTWQLARAAAADFQRDHAQDPQVILVRVQDALTVAARGELLRLEAELLAEPGSSQEDAKSAFREANRMLEQLDSGLTREIPQRHRQTPPPGGLSAAELTALQHQVRFQLSRAQRGLALCYGPESDDRVAMLTQAVATLRQPLTQLAAADPLTDRLRIQLAGCQRLLGNFEAAAETLRAVQPAADQADVALEARAESVRLELAQRHPQQALEVLGQGRQIGDRISPELDFAHLETYLALWRAAHDASEASQAESWRSKSVAMIRLIEQVHGPYWGRRSDLLLVNSIGGARGAADVEVLTRTADNLYRKGQNDEANAAYEKAAQVAAAANRLDLAFQLRHKAALVDQNRQRHEMASEKLRTLGRGLPGDPKAAEAHLLAAWNAAQWSRTAPAALGTYAEILAEHLRLWPQDKTTDTARVWLGRLRESQQDWPAAAAAYQGVARESEHFDESLQAAVRCWERQFRELQDRKEPTETAARTAAECLAKQIEPLLTDPARTWTTQDRFCAEHAARFLMRYTPRGGPAAEGLLQSSLNAKPPPDSKERGRAEAILVAALASQESKIAEAEQVVRRLGDQPPQLLLELLRDLSAVAESATAGAQRELAALWLSAFEVLGGGKSQFGPAVQEELKRSRAGALGAAGRIDEATVAYRDLAAGHPDDAPLQATYAELLLSGSDQISWSEALDLWRRIAARSRPQSDLWYRAKYSNSLALFKLGQKQDAADRIRYIQATTPGLRNTPWADRFAELLRKCQ